MRTPLTEILRPQNLESYVFQNPEHKTRLERMIRDKNIPNCLFVGKAGTGKSTIAKIIIKENGIHPEDLLTIDGSVKNKLDTGVIQQIVNHIRKASIGEIKVIHIEEMDRFTPDVQKALRMSMEEYHDQVRFIATCNYVEKLDPATISRFGTPFVFGEPSRADVIEIIGNGLISEGYIESDEDLDMFELHVDAYYPDMRMIITSVDQSSDHKTKKIGKPIEFKTFGTDIGDWEKVWSDFDFEEILNTVECVEDANYSLMYQTIFENVSKFDDEPSAVILLSDYLDKATRTENHRITLTACVYDLFTTCING